jgi:hypothetical protein
MEKEKMLHIETLNTMFALEEVTFGAWHAVCRLCGQRFLVFFDGNWGPCDTDVLLNHHEICVMDYHAETHPAI